MNHKIFAIEIKDKSIKTAFIEKEKNGYKAVNFNAVKLKSKEDRYEILLYLVNKYSVKKKFFTIISLGTKNFIIRNLELPSSSDQEINSMIGFQILKLSPFTKEEIVYDYLKVFEGTSGYSQLFVPILPKQILGEHEALVKEVGIKCDKFYLSAEATLSCINFFKSRNEGLRGLDSYIVVDIDYFDSDILVIKDDKLLFVRNISYGINELKQSVYNFKNELNTTFSIIKNKYPKFEFGEILITGATLEKDLLENLKEVIGGDFKTLNLSEDSDNLKFNFENIDSKYNFSNLSLFGLFLNNQNLIFSLDSKKTKLNKKKLLKPFISKTAILLYIFVVLLGVILTVKFGEKKQRLRLLDEKLKTINLSLVDVKHGLPLSRITKEDLVEILVEFYNLIPQDISLDSLSYNFNRDFVVKGNALNLKQINEFLSTLKDSRYFRNAQLKYAVKNKFEKSEKVAFEIEFYLKKRP